MSSLFLNSLPKHGPTETTACGEKLTSGLQSLILKPSFNIYIWIELVKPFIVLAITLPSGIALGKKGEEVKEKNELTCIEC